MSDEEKCPHCGEVHGREITPKERADFDQMRARLSEEIDALLAGWREVRSEDGPLEVDVLALVNTIFVRYSPSGMARLLSSAVSRIAELEDRIARSKDPRS